MTANAATFQQIADLRPDFVRFARLQVRDADLAEDLVQEAIEAALKGLSRFNGQSSLKTWVFGILKNKVIDHLRNKDRMVSFSTLTEAADDGDDLLDTLFNERGFWNVDSRPTAWRDPESSLDTQQFWAVFETCLHHMPESIARVFMMREVLGFDTGEICAQLALTTSNCHVILHRARTRLRVCLEQNWFADGVAHA